MLDMFQRLTVLMDTGAASAHPIVAVVVVLGATTVDVSAVGGLEGELGCAATGYRHTAGHRSSTMRHHHP